MYPICMPDRRLEAFSGSHVRSLSTTVVWKAVKIGRRPAGPRAASAKPSALPFLDSRERRRPLTITISDRSAATPRFEVKARGRTWMVDGHDTMLEMMLDLWGWTSVGERTMYEVPKDSHK